MSPLRRRCRATIIHEVGAASRSDLGPRAAGGRAPAPNRGVASRLAPRFGIVCLLAVALGGAACLPVVEVRTRTRILEDGTAVRETEITKVRRDSDDAAEKAWNARPLIEDLGRGFLDAFPGAVVTDDRIRVTGVHPDPEAMPPDFRRDVDVLGASARNHVSFRTEDILIGTRYLYRERYVDAIRPEDQRAARKELVRMAARFVQAMARHEFGQAYETRRFDAFVDEEVAALLDDLIGVYWSERRDLGREDPVTGKTGLDRALERAQRRLERFGLPLAADLTDADHVAIVKAWLTDKLAATLDPRADGARRPVRSDFLYLFPEEEPWTGVQIAMERAAEREFGSVEAARRAFERALLGVTGTFGSPPAEAEFRFDCAVEMPGILLRTNGYLESERSAFWRFEGGEVFPDGVALDLESVVLRPEALGAIREVRHDLDRRLAVRVIAALEGVPSATRDRMRALLAECAARGTTRHLADILAGDDEAQRDAARRLAKVFEVLMD